MRYQSQAGKGSAEAVFGSNLPRLAAIKNKYDPDNVFRRNSNVEPRQPGGWSASSTSREIAGFGYARNPPPPCRKAQPT
jgi:hypothetical protein